MALSSVLRLAMPYHTHEKDDASSIVSSQGTCSSSDCSSSLSSSLDSQAAGPHVHSDKCRDFSARQNEHLAVLIPKRLWKPDEQASHCDIFLCRTRFTFSIRKHHCRRCGGVFCADCSTRFTTLLDTSGLDFMYPPRGVAIACFDSPISPVKAERVCDDCFDQIHGLRSPRSPSKRLAALQTPDLDCGSSVSSGRSSPAPETPILSPSIGRLRYSPRLPSSPLRSRAPSRSPPQSVAGSVAGGPIEDSELALGELESYPLKHSSVVCKANGGGRWEPKPTTIVLGDKLPWKKAIYEEELEREEEEKRIRRANPIIRDGDFQLRAPRAVEPRSPGGPFQFSTF